jgi:5-methylcytosine-specific restriction endonuclease McrA
MSSIITLLNQIKNDEIVLPAIQRSFVWDTKRIYKLLDSIMRGYPIGIVLMWETYNDIQYRSFVRDYRYDTLFTYSENPQKKRLRLVLDGQQRLQSLYVALFGSYEGRSLYFDVLSGKESDDVSEVKYIFTFNEQGAVEKSNAYVREQLSKQVDKRDKEFELYNYNMKVSELFAMSLRDKDRLKQRLSEELNLSEDDRLRLSLSLAQLDEALTKSENILKVSVIDENLPDKSQDRKSESDVLEIFVRTNTAGMELTRSDLVFSMLKLNWRESATALPDFVKSINTGNDFHLDNDFVIRSLFAVSDLGTKFDLKLLRRKSNVAKLQENFQLCCDAIRATVDFVQQDCWCQSSDLVGGDTTMIPFVYYLFHTKDHVVPNEQIPNVRKAFYLFAFAKPFSRYADSRLWKFIRKELKPLVREHDSKFPLKAALKRVAYWERISTFDNVLLQRNIPLALHLVQHKSGAKVQYDRNSPQIDHIFPRSQLRDQGFGEAERNNFANFWILAKQKNQNKSAQHPAKYFADVPDDELERALINREYLDYRRYTTFLTSRGDAILEKAKNTLKIREEDFEGVEEGTVDE